MTKLCAAAMGISSDDYLECTHCEENSHPYDPLHDDAQAMALVKKFELTCQMQHGMRGPSGAWANIKFWRVFGPTDPADSEDLNRAIVECVAKMQAAKEAK
jgi:hypothetical protein